jgi:predicted RNA-binding Zn ribbon-like protein
MIVEREDVTGQVEFNSHTDRVVTVTVHLVNLLTPGEAHGRPYQPPAGKALVSAVTEVLHARREATEEEAAGLAGVAADLKRVFAAISAGDVDQAALAVNRLLVETGARPELERHDGSGWHLHFHSEDRGLVNGWAAGCAAGLAAVVGGPLYERLGVCTAPHCDRVYVDVSRNGMRRFCSTTCQNRVKAAAFRTRQAAGN